MKRQMSSFVNYPLYGTTAAVSNTTALGTTMTRKNAAGTTAAQTKNKPGAGSGAVVTT